MNETICYNSYERIHNMSRTADDVIFVLRAMSWERAKGELNSMLNTYFSEYDGNKRIDTGFDRVSQIVEEFIKEIDGEL